MLNIETKTTYIVDEDGKKREKQYLLVNGIDDKSSFMGSGVTPYARFYNEDVIQILLDNSFDEIALTFSKISFDWEVEWWEDYLEVEIYCTQYFDEAPQIKLMLQLQDWEHWNKAWSMANLSNEFEAVISRFGNEKFRYWQEDPDSILNGFGVQYMIADTAALISPKLNELLSILETLVNETNKNLLASVNKDALLTYFQFPDETKTACSQYLIYFAQFLADIGIPANAEIKEELNQTLFKVVPKDESEGLERIKEALNIYLNAPNNQSFQIEVTNYTDVAVKQWEANIYHLKSQLFLANSIIQANQATIESLQLSNYQYKQLINVKKDVNDGEDLIKGIVTVKDYQGNGFTIKLPEILKRLKRFIR